MGSLHLFNKLLFPTDFSEGSIKAMQFVIDLAKACNSEIIILHTYRLISNSLDDEESMLSKKRKIETDALANFNSLEKALKEANLKYTFISDIGFISDRIVANAKSNQVDLLILCSSMQQKIREKAERGYAGLMSDLECPAMLVPQKVPDYSHIVH